MIDEPFHSLHEKAIVAYVNLHTAAKAYKPTFSTQFSDILLEHNGRIAWLEVKMTHDANLMSLRLKYDNEWIGTGTSAKSICRILNEAASAKTFTELFCDRSMPGEVSLDEMRFHLSSMRQYILEQKIDDISDLVKEHYSLSKRACVHYIQCADSLYRLNDENPLSLPVPIFKPSGTIKVRVAMRSKRYEILTEVKMRSSQESEYSVYPFTQKKNPFSK